MSINLLFVRLQKPPSFIRFNPLMMIISKMRTNVLLPLENETKSWWFGFSISCLTSGEKRYAAAIPLQLLPGSQDQKCTELDFERTKLSRLFLRPKIFTRRKVFGTSIITFSTLSQFVVVMHYISTEKSGKKEASNGTRAEMKTNSNYQSNSPWHGLTDGEHFFATRRAVRKSFELWAWRAN